MSTALVQPSYGNAAQGGGHFEREVLVHLDRVYAGAHWMTSDRAAAEDLVQRTFERAVRDFHWAMPETAVPAWLYRQLVSAWFEGEPRARTPRRSSAAAPGTVDNVILGAKDALAPIVRITLYLADVEDFSTQEIAAITEVPAGIVEARVRRAHQQLADQLAAWLQQDAAPHAVQRSGGRPA